MSMWLKLKEKRQLDCRLEDPAVGGVKLTPIRILGSTLVGESFYSQNQQVGRQEIPR